MKIVKKSLLHYQKGSSNKVYNVYLLENSEGEGFLVNFEYGRYGSNLRKGTKTSSPQTFEKATNIYDSLVRSKIKNGYKLKEGFDSRIGKEKKLRDTISKQEYQEWLISKLKSAKEHHTKIIDNYKLSKLIYKVGEIRLKSAKDLIVDIYKNSVDDSNSFLYSVAFTLGRIGEQKDLYILKEIMEKLKPESKYITKEAIASLSNSDSNSSENTFIKDNLLSQFQNEFLRDIVVNTMDSLLNQNYNKIAITSELVSTHFTLFKEFKNRYSYEISVDTNNSWFRRYSNEDRIEHIFKIRAFFQDMKLKLEDSILSLYSMDKSELNKFMDSIAENDILILKKLYRVANLRDDYETLARISTLSYSSKKDTEKRLGFYLKRRDLRRLKFFARFFPEDYISYSKEILLSLNGFEENFKSSVVTWLDWDSNSIKRRYFDDLSYHTTAFYIINGESKYHTLSKSKKAFERAVKPKDNRLSPAHKELWSNNFDVLLEILSNSEIEIIQKFAFDILKSNPKKLQDIKLTNILPLLKLKNLEAREFFFEVLKEKFINSKDEKILKAFILSGDKKIVEEALNFLKTGVEISWDNTLLRELIIKGASGFFDDILDFVIKSQEPKNILNDVVAFLLQQKLPLAQEIKDRFIKTLKELSEYLELRHIEAMFKGDDLNDFMLIGAKLIRESGIDIPLSLKEKISKFQHPQMIATLIFMLGTLPEEALINQSELLTHFLFFEDNVVQKEAQKLIKRLSKRESFAKKILEEIAQNSFKSINENSEDTILQSVKYLKAVFKEFPIDVLYRLIVAKSRVANMIGAEILINLEYDKLSVNQWISFAKNRNKMVREWAFKAFEKYRLKIESNLPKPLEIFDTNWKDTREFAMNYFKEFNLTIDEVIIIADSNYPDVQMFAKELIIKNGFDNSILAQKLSQHPSQIIQKFVTDTILESLNDEELSKLDSFFHKILLSINSNRMAKTTIIDSLDSKLKNKGVALMYADLIRKHYNSIVKSDRERFIFAMYKIKKEFPEISLPIQIIDELEVRSAI